MGLERAIPATTPFDWPRLVARLGALGESPILRMIDGLPAFPDEVPPDEWRELRIGLTGGMVTLRRTSDGYACVTWGTADPALEASTDRLVRALGASADG
jgi:hypothetical protein